MFTNQQNEKNIKNIINIKDIIKTLFILIIVTILGTLFQMLDFTEANIIIVYILGVLITAIVTSSRVYSIFSSIISVFIFNFLFTVPYYNFKVDDPRYVVTFLIMFMAAFISGSLTVKIKNNAYEAAQTAYRTQILLDTNQMLQKETDKEGIIKVICYQLVKLLNKNIIFYPIDKEILKPHIFYVDDTLPIKEEFDIVQWVASNTVQAGASTDHFQQSNCFYLPIKVNNKSYGVIGIQLGNTVMDDFETNIVLSIIGEGSLAFDTENANKEKTEADLRAKNEQLRANLLRSISHDLRTPLTSISGNAGILLSQSENLDKEKKNVLYHNIYDDSLWLINLVENLLSVSRITDGTMQLNKTTELIDEVVHEALTHIRTQKHDHQISYIPEDEFILTSIDTRLIMQVIINLVDNAIKYTPQNSQIMIKTFQKDRYIYIDVIDDGFGVSDEMKEHIFDMFYTGNKTVADSRRSLGLGLSLCQSIVNAHGGTIQVFDHQPHGAIFEFTLPIKEVILHE